MREILLHENVLASLALIVGVLITKWIVVRKLRSTPFASGNETKRRWISGVQNAAMTLIILGIIFIWLSEIQAFALSVAAFIVALVISTKEYIQCVVGSLYRTSARPFVVGDWIQVGNIAGEVTHTDWLTTKLYEVDLDASTYSYNGKSVVIPNSQLVMTTTKNISYMKKFVTHTFEIVREPDDVNFCELAEPVEHKLRDYCSNFIEIAERHNKSIEKRLDISLPDPAPSARVKTSNIGKNIMSISFFCPTTKAIAIEQKITADFMQLWYERKAAAKLKNEAQKH